MSNDLYKSLKDIGINEELAHRVDKSLSPEHIATKADLLVMQEAILQTQMKAEKRFYELSSKIDGVNSNLKIEIAAISRQFWITFGGLITTILCVFGVNWYFH